MSKNATDITEAFAAHRRFSISFEPIERLPLQLKLRSRFATSPFEPVGPSWHVRIDDVFLQRPLQESDVELLLRTARLFHRLFVVDDALAVMRHRASLPWRELCDRHQELRNSDAQTADVLGAAGLRGIWQKLRSEYFPERSDLDDYEISWADRNHVKLSK